MATAAGSCVSCGKDFYAVGGKKRISKRSITSKLQKIDKTVKNVLEDEFDIELTPQDKETRFLCEQCSWTIASFSKSREASRQSLEKLKMTASQGGYLAKKLRSPVPTPRKLKRMRIYSPQKPEKEVQTATVEQESYDHKKSKKKVHTNVSEYDLTRATKYLKLRLYKRGLEMLLKSRAGARTAFVDIVTNKVREEMVAFLKERVVDAVDLEQLVQFSWDELYENIQRKCPMLTACISASCTSRTTNRTLSFRHNSSVSIKPTMGTVMSILAYQIKPKSRNKLQTLNSLLMWLSSCKRQLFSSFNHLGLSVGIKATRNTLDHIRQKFDSEVMSWRSAITDHLLLPSDSSEVGTVSEESDQPMSIDGTPISSPVRSVHTSPVKGQLLMTPQMTRQLHRPSTTEQGSITASESSNSVQRKGKLSFSICFDNVNQKTTVRHQTRDRKNKMYNMVQGYAALDRVHTLHLSDEPPTPEDIVSIPLSDILPNEMDEVDLRYEMTIMVERILCKRLPAFTALSDNINWHINHPYSQESSQKSHTVLLGVMDKDESRVGDTIDILDEYHKYVPLKPDGNPLIIPLHADGLSCERVNDAQNARLNGTSAWTQLQGLVPNIQEWHKRCLLLQDIYDELYSGKSSREKGTLFHLKNFFEQRNVTGNVKESFNYNEDFLEFCLEGYVTLLAMHLLNTETLQEVPDGFPQDKEDQRRILHDTASKIIDMVFQSSSSIVQQIVQNPERTATSEDKYPFCICKTERPGEIMVFCDNRNCPRGVWFHIECVDMEEEDIPSGAWFCCEDCKGQKSSKKKKSKKTVADNLRDKKLDYTLLLMWRGLSQMVRKDAIRENNGKFIIMHWKFDMLQFYAEHHPKYFLICQRLLMAVSGGVSPRLKHALIWNRTVNPNGGKGKNIAMDLQMEYFNKEYKESVKDAAGQLTEATIARHSQMIGIGKELKKVYDIQVCGLSGRNVHKNVEERRDSDFTSFVKLMHPEDIFTPHPGRYHNSFADLQLNVFAKVVPRNMRARMTRIRKEQSNKVKIVKVMQHSD